MYVIESENMAVDEVEEQKNDEMDSKINLIDDETRARRARREQLFGKGVQHSDDEEEEETTRVAFSRIFSNLSI